MHKLKVVDFFCGAGGFSEGFKQMGFEIIKGYDNWKPAIDTFNHNLNLNSEIKNILEFNSIEEINKIPDTEIIIGSPPCVSFSSSNKSGNADKSLGLKLTETYLRIIAVKKHQRNSLLKAWFMENVANTKKYLKSEYTFDDLDIGEWARSIGQSPQNIALDLKEKMHIINSADYGCFQARKRLFVGEIIPENKFPLPPHSYKAPNKREELPNYRTLKSLKKDLKSPFIGKNNKIEIKDPNYKIVLFQKDLTDHFYDTGIYEVEVRFSQHWKTNHPYMGKMSFPENENNPSRTITATRIANSRESLIYKSEIRRSGDGEYRLPTVREAASIMGFPITYQFKGSENTKWKLIGNAVCPPVSRILASNVLKFLNKKTPSELILSREVNLDEIINLNTFALKKFDNPPQKQAGAKCRWHTFKDGNLTVSLSNFIIGKNTKTTERWISSIQYGTGKGFPSQIITEDKYLDLKDFILKQKKGKDFIKIMNNGFVEKIGSVKELQRSFEIQENLGKTWEPTRLVDLLGSKINELKIDDILISNKYVRIFKHKDQIPLKQLYALYGINKIVSIANKK